MIMASTAASCNLGIFGFEQKGCDKKHKGTKNISMMTEGFMQEQEQEQVTGETRDFTKFHMAVWRLTMMTLV